jgi:hypothetical protein
MGMKDPQICLTSPPVKTCTLPPKLLTYKKRFRHGRLSRFKDFYALRIKGKRIIEKAMGKGGWKIMFVRFRMIIVLGFIFVLVLGFTKMALAMGKGVEVPKMTKEELRPMLGSPDVAILDVRLGAEWTSSKWKIQGAIREDPEKGIQSWVEKYPKDKTLVLY